MTNATEKLIGLLAELPSRLPESVIDQIISELDRDTRNGLRGKLHTLSSTPGSRQILMTLDEAWANCPELNNSALSAALMSARLTEARQKDAQELKIIWTGPATEAVPLRRTEQALKEVIDGANSSLSIVSFVTYKVDEIMAALKRASDRGVVLRMIYETEKDSGGKLSFDQVARIHKLVPAAMIYRWPLSKRQVNDANKPGTIHAKCAVADRHVALISSANLTEFALELNMELGVLVRGGFVAKSIEKHFDELIARGVLEAIE